MEWPLQDTLLFADCIVRNLTGEKYISAVGNYSLESQRKDYLDKFDNEIMPLFNRAEEDWSSSYAAFEEGD